MAASSKNDMISPAASALGLGDQLHQQLEDNLDDEKKKKLMAATQGGYMDMGSPAAMSLFGQTR
jgi:hypothetical protein